MKLNNCFRYVYECFEVNIMSLSIHCTVYLCSPFKDRAPSSITYVYYTLYSKSYICIIIYVYNMQVINLDICGQNSN